MTVRDVVTDTEALTMTFTAEFDAPVERVWQVLADARQLERWWGPPEWPASFTRHDMVVGGESHYVLTGPEGEEMAGWWSVTAVEEPTRLAFDDGFADEDGTPVESSPVIDTEITLAPLPGGRALMTTRSRFSSLEAFEELAQMGMEEGMRFSLGQIDALLVEQS
ncbi:MAG: SRPBCC domain-containing protein [Microcella sp.]|uniref:SRPBCC family protein n=1 Tax=Microcella sp. TaxID=1913979 RepID=UPI003315A44D